MNSRWKASILLLATTFGLTGCRGCQDTSRLDANAPENTPTSPPIEIRNAATGSTNAGVGSGTGFGPGARTATVFDRSCGGAPLIEAREAAPRASFDFRKYDSPSGGQTELLVDGEAGCLAYDLELSVSKEVQRWAKYEVVEQLSDGRVRTVFVVDPPGFPCDDCSPGLLTVAGLPDDCLRATGKLGKSIEPIRIEDIGVQVVWQLVKTNPEQLPAGRLWQDPNSKDVVRSEDIGVVEQKTARIKLCLDDLEKLYKSEGKRFWLVVQTSLPGRPGSEFANFSQTPVTRDRVIKARDHLLNAKPAGGGEP